MIAQEVRKVMPEAVSVIEGGTLNSRRKNVLAIRDFAVVTHLVGAVQALYERVQLLEGELDMAA